MFRPVRVPVLPLDPGSGLLQLVAQRSQREAVPEVRPPVAEREELGAQKIHTTGGTQHNRRPGKCRLGALLPPRRECLRKLLRSVVQPVLVKRLPMRSLSHREVPCGLQDGRR